MFEAPPRDGSHAGSSAGPGREHRRGARRPLRRGRVLRLLHCVALLVTVVCACLTRPASGMDVLGTAGELGSASVGAARWTSALTPFREWHDDAAHAVLDLRAEESDASDSSPDVADDDAFVILAAAPPPREAAAPADPETPVYTSRDVLDTGTARGPPV